MLNTHTEPMANCPDCIRALKINSNIEKFNEMRDKLKIQFGYIDEAELSYPMFFTVEETKYIWNLINRDIKRDEK